VPDEAFKAAKKIKSGVFEVIRYIESGGSIDERTRANLFASFAFFTDTIRNLEPQAVENLVRREFGEMSTNG